jgi:anti-sigma B factor antagonist
LVTEELTVDSDNRRSDTFAIATRTLTSGRLLLAVDGELDLANAPLLREALDRELAAGQRVLLDLSGVTFIDSTGLAAIVNAARGPGAQLELSADMRSQARRLMELTGVLSLFPVVNGDAG